MATATNRDRNGNDDGKHAAEGGKPLTPRTGFRRPTHIVKRVRSKQSQHDDCRVDAWVLSRVDVLVIVVGPVPHLVSRESFKLRNDALEAGLAHAVTLSCRWLPS